jgi:uncharacterized protein
MDRRSVLLGVVAAVLAPGRTVAFAQAPASALPPDAASARLIAAAEAQIGVTTRYDAAYERLTFPGGDVPPERGVCTDVVVRAFRVAFGADLQALVNADMKAAFSAYPRNWGLTAPDPNIDHRRVPNLRAFFKRQGASLPVPASADGWRPGDLVTQSLPVSGRPHIGIVGATRDSASGRLLVVHNIGFGTQASDILAAFTATGRYRFMVGA